MPETQPRDPSPAFPVISLKDALERLVAFEDHLKRMPARPEKLGEAGTSRRRAMPTVSRPPCDTSGCWTTKGNLVPDLSLSPMRGEIPPSSARGDEAQFNQSSRSPPPPNRKALGTVGGGPPKDAACLDDLTMHHGFSLPGARDPQIQAPLSALPDLPNLIKFRISSYRMISVTRAIRSGGNPGLR